MKLHSERSIYHLYNIAEVLWFMLFYFTNTYLHVELIHNVVSISIEDVIKYTAYNIIP